MNSKELGFKDIFPEMMPMTFGIEKSHKSCYPQMAINNKPKLSIDKLTDKCLIHIFEFLPIESKLIIELVCKKWRNLGKNNSWNKVKTFEISHDVFDDIEFIHDDKISFNCRKKFNFISNVLQRCSSKIENLTIDNYLTGLDCSKLLKKVSKSCHNIKRLFLKRLEGLYITYEEYDEEDKYLESLFANNKNISSITLEDVQMRGECLSSLHPDSITELIINESFLMDGERHLYELLPKLKNLKILEIDLEVEVDELVAALEESNNENIQKFSLNAHECPEDMLLSFISKQKNLLKLEIFGFTEDNLERKFFNALPKNNIEKLNIPMDEDISYALSSFKNLKSIRCVVDNLTDQFVKNLLKCENLKKLYFNHIEKLSLTTEGENSFEHFKNLELLSFRKGMFSKTEKLDNILKAVAKCEKLKDLRIERFDFTDSCLESISLMKNLNSLTIPSYEKDTAEFIKKIADVVVNNLVNLKKLTVFGLGDLYDLFKTVNQLKTIRRDKEPLEIWLFRKYFVLSGANRSEYDEFPLAKLKLYKYF